MRIRFLHTEGFRLSAIYAVAFALSMLLMGTVVVLVTGHAFRDQLLQSSQADIAAIHNGYASEGLPEAREVVEQLLAAPGASDFFLLQKDGVRIAGNLAPMTITTGAVTLPAAGARREVLGIGALIAPGVYVFSGSDLVRVHAAQEKLIHLLLWLFLAALLVAGLGGALVSRGFLRRTDAMTRACRAIMDGDLKTRIPVRGTRDELDRLASTVNEMLGRIAALMENLRQVTNDVAHDLRTPVTHLRHGLERARVDCATPADYASALDTAIVRSDEILALFTALLRIAQIEGGARRAGFAEVELGALLRHMRELFGAVAEEAGHHLDLVLEGDALLRVTANFWCSYFSNLIENSILHTPAGTRIVMKLSRRQEHILVTVSDDGPGVPRAEYAKLFQRLYRREASRTSPGYGLGLSLVTAIAELHGATASIVESAEPGLSVEVAFPPIHASR